MFNLIYNTMCIRNLILIVILAIINIVGYYLHRKNSKDIEKRKKDPKQNLDENKEDVLNDDVEPNSWYVWAMGILVCLDVWIIGAVITYSWADWFFEGDKKNIEQNKAIFGDSFGAVNALISAFAFGGVIVNFFFQRYELKLQRKELEAQRMEFEQQNKTLGLQRFENTFFNMLQLQQEIVAGLEYTQLQFIPFNDPEPRPTYKGREVFKAIFENEVTPSLESEGIESYSRLKNISLLDHYFRHFYTILNFVDKSLDIDKFSSQSEGQIMGKKYEYAKILRATLSRYELVLLYYNGLSEFGIDKLKPLIEKYSMLNNLNKELLALSSDNIPGGFLYDERIIRETFIKKCGDKNYPPTDYLFNITQAEIDENRYNVGAFYHNKEDQEKEIEKVMKFYSELHELKSNKQDNNNE